MAKISKTTEAARKTAVTFFRTFPIVLGVLALASLMTAALPPERVSQILPVESVFGPPIGAVLGSVAAGHPLTSYVLAGELTAAGAGFATVTALIVSWVTVGIVHLPAEAAILGVRFAIVRNLLSFVLAIVMAYLVAIVLPLVP